jgi:beta-lactam-binding protein with PASTA domain
MGIIAASATAIGKLILVGILLAAFLAGMAGVVYMSLSGTEVKVPEIVGKDFVESEKELAALGLKIKKRADRPSSEKMNTVLEQLPRPGETVKTGQMILVVVAKAPAAGEEAPKSLIQDIESDDTEKIEEMISDKPKTTRTNTNSNSNRKKADTTRDVIANSSPTSSNTSDPDSTPKSSDDAEKKEPGTGTTPAGNRSTPAAPATRPQASPNAGRQSDGEKRPRRTPQP